MAAILLTEGCQLDKRDIVNGAPVHRITRLTFAPLRPIDDFEPHDQELLRALHTIDPPEGIYLDDVEGEECAAMLGEAFWLPAAYFSPQIADFSGTPDIGLDPMRLVAGTNDDRVCGMSLAERILMQDKMHVFWTATKRKDSSLVRQDPVD